MDSVLTIGDFLRFSASLVVVGLSVIAGVLAYVNRSLKEKATTDNIGRLWDKHDTLDKEFDVYQVDAAKTFATVEQLQKIEERIIRHFDNQFGNLQDNIRRELNRKQDTGSGEKV